MSARERQRHRRMRARHWHPESRYDTAGIPRKRGPRRGFVIIGSLSTPLPSGGVRYTISRHWIPPESP